MAGRAPGGVSGSGIPNPLHITFKNPDWPPNFITPENVLDYFCNPANRFYDTSSCNQMIRMQNMNDRPLEENLIRTTGIQYVLWSAQPPLYVICKHRRNSPQNVTPLAYYYVINGVVYQSPDLYTFVQSRMLAVVDPLKKAFDEVISLSRYNVAKGYYWQFKNKPTENEEKEEEKPQQARSSNFQRTRANMLMQILFEQCPPGGGATVEPAPNFSKADDDTQSVKSGSAASVRPSDTPSESAAQKRLRPS